MGHTYNLQWYFYVDPKNVVTNGFFNIHQIFGEGFGPLLCHGFQYGKFYVSHSEGAARPEYLGSTDLKNMMGILVNETVHFDQKGWYQVTFADAQTGQTIYSVSFWQFPQVFMMIFRFQEKSVISGARVLPFTLSTEFTEEKAMFIIPFGLLVMLLSVTLSSIESTKYLI